MPRQTLQTQPRNQGLLLLLGLGALALLIGVPAVRLHERGLSRSEAAHAWTAVGPLGHEQGHDESLADDAVAHRLLRGWASGFGTTETALRLPFVLSLILAALVTGEAAAALFGAAWRPTVWLLFAASPFLNRPDHLHPELLASLPVALLSGSFVFRRDGAGWWLLAPVAGAAALPFVGDEAAIVAAGVLIALLVTLVRSPLRTATVILVSSGALALAWWASRRPLEWPSIELGLGWSSLLPPVALLAAGALSRLPRAATALTCTVALAFTLLPLTPYRGLLGNGGDNGTSWEADLDRARDLTRSGGRLVLTGPDRWGMLYTARHGRHPGVPLLLVPEEVAMADLAATLREQLQAWRGQETGLPPVLIHPAPDTAPPGCAIAPDPASDLAVLLLR